MKRLALVLVVWLGVLSPAPASANDGGWLDWLYRLDMAMTGIGTDFHVLCLDDNLDVLACERFFRIPELFGASATNVEFDRIRHQIDARVGFYWKRGERFPDVPDTRRVNAWRLMGMYYYQFDRRFQLGAGAGYVAFFGDGFDLFSRGIITPLSAIFAPFDRGALQSFYVRVETIYTTQGFSGADFGNPFTAYSTGGEWQPSVAIGFDLRRRR